MIRFTPPILLTALGAIMMSACVTTPKAIEKPVEVEPVIVRTCTPKSELVREVTPAEYKTVYTSNSVEDAPEYRTDPETGLVVEIERSNEATTVPHQILVKDEQVIYKNDEGVEVTDICSDELEAVTSPAS